MDKTIKKYKTSTARCSGEFIETVWQYIFAFEEKYKVRMSFEEATRKINKKIADSGGLIVD
jgi:hypothetical protein